MAKKKGKKQRAKKAVAKKRAKKKRKVNKKKRISRKPVLQPKKAKPKKATIVIEPGVSIHRPKIRVIGIGGGGCSIVSEIASQVEKTDFVAANTDLQALREVRKKCRRFHFGQNLTRGLGCGMDPRLGQRAAKEEREKIAKLLQGADLCILVSTLGGGTGSGAVPEFARIAETLGIMTIGIFTLPFKFEGEKRMQLAKSSLDKAEPHFNAVNLIPNEKVFQIIEKNTSLKESFSVINKRLAEILKGFIEMIYSPGIINIDFADVRAILDNKGKQAFLNIVEVGGATRAEEVSKNIFNTPLSDYVKENTDRILYNIAVPPGLGMKELGQISSSIAAYSPKAKIIFGISKNNDAEEKLRITLLAVGKKREIQYKKEVKIPDKILPAPPQKKKKAKKKRKKTNNPVGKSNAPEKLESGDRVLASLPRRNALELKKQAEEDEKQMQTKEAMWDTPAFLRKKEDN